MKIALEVVFDTLSLDRPVISGTDISVGDFFKLVRDCKSPLDVVEIYPGLEFVNLYEDRGRVLKVRNRNE